MSLLLLCFFIISFTGSLSSSGWFYSASSHALMSCDSCPIGALGAYLNTRDRWFGDRSPLFLDSHGKVLTRSWFLKRFHAFFGHNKLGHSMRSGGASAMAQAGLPLEFIQGAGRWSSEAFKSYVRDHPVLRLRARADHPIATYWHAGAFVNFS